MTALDTQSTPTLPVRKGLSIPAQLGPVIGLVGIFILFSILRNRSFPTLENLQNMLMMTAVVAMAALGMTIIIISGGIDLSPGSNIALSSVAIAILLKNGHSPLLSALGGVAVATLCGMLIGILIGAAGLQPFIVTLGMWGALRGAAIGLAGKQTVYTGRETWLDDLLHILPPEQKWMLLPPGVWFALVMAILVAAGLRYTRFGRHVFAVGSNEQTARLCGVNVVRAKVLVYTLGGFFTGLAAVLQFSTLTQGDPTTANGLELDIIAAVVVGGASLSGGQGYVFASLVGALLMTVIANGCTKLGIDNWVQQIITGAIIILAALIDKLRHRRAE
jgi:ribose/xylose/arabinose/galactoside ABC-type transport system permease subunit